MIVAQLLEIPTRYGGPHPRAVRRLNVGDGIPR
jgi:hypothetical protein